MPPDNYVPLVIIAIILCCPPGIVALVHCLRVKRYWQAGERDAARRASRSAKRWSIAAMLVPLLLFVAFILHSAFGSLIYTYERDLQMYENRPLIDDAIGR